MNKELLHAANELNELISNLESFQRAVEIRENPELFVKIQTIDKDGNVWDVDSKVVYEIIQAADLKDLIDRKKEEFEQL